ncbi:hypothetical protein N7465_003097 [Penicillium sp. CMV-2018d]|nr:hypothetical protein N7465_003097 [Penicillium sp. CMV-2018d]
MASSSPCLPDEKVQSFKIPFFRMIFDQGAVTQDVINCAYPGAGTAEEPHIISWVTNDPRDPMAFSEVSKWAVMSLISIMTFVVALVSSAYSGATVEVIECFRVSEEVSLLGVSLFVIGFAVGPLFWGPLGEIYGRRYIFLASAILMAAFTAGAAGSQNIQTLVILRFFAGSFGAAPMAVSGGVIADTFPAVTRGLAGGLFCTAPFLGPTLGPIVGGFLGESAGWRWVEGLLAALTGILAITMFFFLPETYAPVLLRQRAARLHQITGRHYHSKLDDTRTPPRQALMTALSRPWVLLFREPIVLLLSFYTAVIYGILYMLFAAYPIVFQSVRGWSEGKGGLAFIGILVGILFAEASTFPTFFRYKRKSLAAAPYPLAPEARLPDSFVGCVALPAGLFWFAWTAAPPTHWMVPIAAGVPFGFGMVTVFLPVFNYLIDSYTIFAASVMSANLILRSIFGTVFPLFTVYMYRGLSVGWASSIPAFLALACMPMPFLFYKYGAKVRQRCHYSAQSEAFVNKLIESAAAQAASAASKE